MASYPHYSNGMVQRRASSNVFRPTSSSSSSRPRSFYGSTGVSQSLLGSSSYYNPNSQSSPYLNYNPNSSFSTYGGTSSGYGGLTLPGSSSLSNYPSSSSLTSHHGLSSSPTSYHNSILHSSGLGSRPGSPAYASTSSGYQSPSSSRTSSNLPSRSGSFNRHSHSPLLSSNLGSRSSSAASLATSIKSNDSEGYASGNERTSRLGSVSGDTDDRSSISLNPPKTENGELDYKKLYEESRLENGILREKLRKTEEDLQEVKALAEKSTNNASKVSLSEVEKRERRAMERKLSEMEEELKQLEQLRNDNQKLKDENGALIRVISKLSK